jgi:hypothetical protein
MRGGAPPRCAHCSSHILSLGYTMIVPSFKVQTTGIWRVCLVAASSAVLAIAVLQSPSWLNHWDIRRVAVVAVALGLSALGVYIAIRASAQTVARVVLEGSGFVCALISAEAILLLHSPEKWPDSPLAQRMIAREHAAIEQGINYDDRLRTEVVQELQSQGRMAVPGFAQGMATSAAAVASSGPRDLLPLSNVSDAEVVECNEGTGYLTFHSGDFGFNNPSGLAAGPLDIAVFGASLALGQCVPRSSSIVSLLRAHYPRTATFGVAGARVLSQLAVFREYVQPVKPALVIWVIDANFAIAREEASHPILVKYLDDAAFSQHLRRRQNEVDSFVRDVLEPLNRKQDQALAVELDRARRFPFDRLPRLEGVRSIVGIESILPWHSPPAPEDLSYFEAATDRIEGAVTAWGGALLVVVAPSYSLLKKEPASMARYRAVLEALSASHINVVDGVALFDAQSDPIGLFALRMDSHPNEQGHLLLANAVIEAIERQGLM